MKTFISLLMNNSTFSLDYKNKCYDVKEIIEIVLQKASEIDAHLQSHNDVIFYLPKNNFEAFICLCVNSLLGTTGAFLTTNNARSFSSLISNKKHRLVVISDKLMNPDIEGEVVRIHFTASHPLSDDKKAALLARLNPDTPHALIFTTSGTTGNPKLIKHTEDKLIHGAEDFAAHLQLTEASKILCMFPIQFMYGLAVTLAALTSGSTIHYSHLPYNPEFICDYSIQHHINILPVLGDWIIDICHILKVKNKRISNILNASDRLLVNQAHKALECCDTLWNTFGQTESGPSLLHNKIESEADIDRFSYNGVIAAGFVLSRQVETSLIHDAIHDDRCGELIYKTPYGMEGYMDEEMNLLPHSSWNESGDLFYINEEGCHFWLRRLKEDLKVNGRFFPSQIIYNDFVENIGTMRCIFSKNIQGMLCLYIDESNTPGDNINIVAIKNIIHKHWNYSQVEIIVKESLSKTLSGKLRLVQA